MAFLAGANQSLAVMRGILVTCTACGHVECRRKLLLCGILPMVLCGTRNNSPSALASGMSAAGAGIWLARALVVVAKAVNGGAKGR